MAPRLVTSPIISTRFNETHDERTSIAQDEHYERRSHDPVASQPNGKSLLQEIMSSRKASTGSYPRRISSRAQTFDSGYGSNESLARPPSTIDTITKRSSLKSVYTVALQETADSNPLTAGRHQALQDQKRLSTAQFSNHRMLASLNWLMQNPAWPFPEDEDFVILAASSQLKVQYISSWFLWSQQRLLHHANGYLDDLPVVEESECELERLPVFIGAPSPPRTQYSDMRDGLSYTRPKLGRPWNSEWLHVQRQKLKQVRGLSSIPSLVYTIYPAQRPMYSIATILGSTAALTLGLSVPRERIELHLNTDITRMRSGIGKDVKLQQECIKRDIPPRLQERQAPVIQSQSDITCKDETLNTVAGDYSESIDRWLADLVVCNLEVIRASLKQWQVLSIPDQNSKHGSWRTTIDVLPPEGPIESDDTDETDFHSLQLGERSPSYLVGACNSAHQTDNANNIDFSIPPSPSATSEELHVSSQLESAISDSTSFVSEAEDSVAQIGLWRKELETFIIWARTHVLPSLVQFVNSRPESSLNSSSSVRSCATGETSQNNSNGQVENTSFLTPGDHQDGNKRKRRESDNGNRPSKGSLSKSRARTSGNAAPRKNFACHYHKHDRQLYSNLGHTRYKSCSHGFEAINRLKGHLDRVHKPGHYCFRCKTIFKEQNEMNQHVANPVRCEERGSPDFDAMIITEERKEALLKKAPDARTEEDEWYRMWDCLSLDDQRPESPYQDISPEMMEFRERAERRLPEFVQSFRSRHLTRSIPDVVLTEIYRIAIEILTDEAEPHIRSQTRTVQAVLAPEAVAVGHGEILPPNLTDPLSGGPWHANSAQTAGAFPQQAISDVDTVFRQPTSTIATQLPPAETQLDWFNMNEMWYPNLAYNGDHFTRMPVQGDPAGMSFVPPVNRFMNGTGPQHMNIQ